MICRFLPPFGRRVRRQPGGPSPVEDALAKLNPDDMTPKAALEALYALKKLKGGA